MRQTRLSLGCQDWQRILSTIGPVAAAVLLKIRLLMRSMGTAEVSLTAAELAGDLKITEEQVRDAIAAIIDNGLLTAQEDTWGVVTFKSGEEATALREREKKRTAKALSRLSFAGREIPRGNSPETVETKYKPYKREEVVVMNGKFPCEREQKEKAPQTPQKIKSLTENIGHAYTHATVVQPELPADALETEYADVICIMTASTRKALQKADEETREAFYLFIRGKREEMGDRFGSDAIRAAWLAAVRIPAERRAESILAARMGGWKTIRDCGSGVYFEKGTGRVVSLVRGPVEYQPQSASRKANADLAVKLAQSMRRA